MKQINTKIVYSNDIKRILNGNNALNYSYEKNGIKIPSSSFIEELRKDFKNTVKMIYEKDVTIITEEEMLKSIYSSIKDVISRYPHCILR